MYLELLTSAAVIEGSILLYLHFKPRLKTIEKPVEVVRHVYEDLDSALVLRARHLVNSIDGQFPHEGGEWKRHQVYAVLLEEFPQLVKRDLALAIEFALRS